ncbi:MAG: T9SS type A sorting domain-containing protein [Ignavibacteriales bacterium]|nr:T9SS type A sorting domain-containing protein [Ignavibacteriales bacterium]
MYLTFNEEIREQAGEIKIYSINGEKTGITSFAGNNTLKIDVSGLTNGVYILQVTGKGKKIIKSQKIIIDQE